MNDIFEKKLWEIKSSNTSKRCMLWTKQEIKQRIDIIKSLKGKQCKDLSNFEYGLNKRFAIKKFGSEEILIRQLDEKSIKRNKNENHIAAIEDFSIIIEKYHREIGHKCERSTYK